jgi:hypothetical protein
MKHSGSKSRPLERTSKPIQRRNNIQRHRKLLERCGASLGVTHLNDWYKIPKRVIHNKLSFIRERYGNFNNALRQLYPEHKWEENEFAHVSRNYWNDLSHQKQELEKIAAELGIKELDDWYGVPRSLIRDRCSFIHKHGGSLYKTLKEVYPEHNWDESRFSPKHYWKDIHKQRKKFEEVAKELNINELDDWYKVSRAEVYNRIHFVKEIYNDLLTALRAIYPQHPWDETRFKVLPKNYWKDAQHQKLKLESIAAELNIKELDDWYNVPKPKLKGVSMMKYSGSIYSIRGIAASSNCRITIGKI